MAKYNQDSKRTSIISVRDNESNRWNGNAKEKQIKAPIHM